MARNSRWNDDYWIFVLQLYMNRPQGVKPTYCREAVELCMELHVHPEELHLRLEQLDSLKQPSLERLWNNYARHPKKLARAVSLLRQMYGFGNKDSFYEGVEVNETFERDFRPLDMEPDLMPAMLIIILDLYFRLTVATMTVETPEVQELARLFRIPARLVVDVLEGFQSCDPFFSSDEVVFSYLMGDCIGIWSQYANMPQEKLNTYAQELTAYFK